MLDEAADGATPLLERVKFAAITASNLDEYFMVRVARLKNAVREGDADPDPSGHDAGAAAGRRVGAGARDGDAALRDWSPTICCPRWPGTASASPALRDLDVAQQAAVAAYFRDEVLPALTPLAIDVSRPFPLLSSLSLNLALRLTPAEPDEPPRLAVVQVPSRLPRLVRVAGGEGATFVPLEDVIRGGFDALFPGQTVLESAAFRMSRDAELELDDEGGQSYLEALEEELRRRRKSDVVRLEVEDRASDGLVRLLVEQAGLEGHDLYRVPGLLDLRALLGARRPAGIRRAARERPEAGARAAARRAGGDVRRRSTRATSCCTTRTTRSTRWWRWSSRRPTIRTCWPSSRRSTGPAPTRRSSPR